MESDEPLTEKGASDPGENGGSVCLRFLTGSM